MFTHSVFQGIQYPCSVVVMVLRGVAQGVSTAQLSKELDLDYSNLLKLRHHLRENAYENIAITPLTDIVTETHEMFQVDTGTSPEVQYAGEKGKLHILLNDPPR